MSILLSYSNPELPGCEPERRERWLEQLYPQTTRLVVTNERLANGFRGSGESFLRTARMTIPHRAFTASVDPST